MNATLLVQVAWTFGLISLMSIGGANATLPEIHRQVVEQLHWMDDAAFAHLVAIGQTAPGPNVMVVSLIGWKAAGLAGLFIATVAIVLPSSTLAVVVSRYLVRHESSASVALVRRALSPIAIGLMLASGVIMTKAAYAGILTLVGAGIVAAGVLFTKISPLWGIAAGVIAGITLRHAGL
jgi:chromate transporter